MDISELVLNAFWIVLYLIILVGFIVGLISTIISVRRNNVEKLHEYDLTFLQIKVPQDNEIEIKAAEQLFSSLVGLRKPFFKALFTGQWRVSFEIVSKIDGIGFYVVAPDEAVAYVEKQINGVYPTAEIDIVNPKEIWDRGRYTKVAELTLKGLFFSPIKNHEDMKVDPLNNITSAMSKLTKDEVLAVQYILKPANDVWRQIGRAYINQVKIKTSNPEKNYNIDASYLEGIEKKIACPGFDTTIRVVAISDTPQGAEAHVNSVASSFEQFSDVNYNKFVKRFSILNMLFPQRITDDFIYRRLRLKDYSIPILNINIYRNMPILNTVELATIFHFPNKNVQTPNIMWLTSRKASAPTRLPNQADNTIWIGQSNFRGVKTEVHTKQEDRKRHFYIIGQTGTGKSELLKYMALQDIKNGEGVAVIDPHGTDVQDLLTKIPPERINDVIYFNASDTEMPMGINVLENSSISEQHMIINSFIALLYKMYDPNRQGIMGPQIERAIRNVMLTAMYDPNSTLVDVLRLLIDPKYVQKFIPIITDPLVKKYWTDEVARTSENRKGETMGYFVSKFDKFVTDKLMRNIFGQPKSSFNFAQVMSEKKILLADLAKGKIGEENSNFLGLILVPKILTSALARQNLIEQGVQFPNFFLYVDEFQNFATPDFEVILSEARKYKLNLTVAHQFIAQLPDDTKEAIFGNVGSMCTFRVGADDAKFMENYYSPVFTQQDISNLPVGNCYVRLLVDGHPTPPFSMSIPWDVIQTKVTKSQEIANKIRELSRQKYGIPAAKVEEYINMRAGFNDPQEPAPQEFPKRRIPF